MPMKTIEGYSKEKYTNTSVLLAGGGAKALSDFIGSLSWDSTNKKIKYTPVGGSATDLVTLSWDNIANKPTSLPANGGNADTVDNKHASDFMPSSGSYISGTTVADVKTNLLNYFRNKPATTTAYTQSTFVNNFENDSYIVQSSSVCGWIALNPGYDNYNHGHFLVSEYGNNRLRHIGLGYNTWYGPYTIAYTSDIPTNNNQLTNGAGYITGITKKMVTDALGYTPPTTNTTYNFSGTSFTSGNSSTGEHNANNITSNGHWYYSSNGPSTSLGASTDDGALYSQAYSTSWVGQIAQDYRNGNLFTRGRNNGTWTDWKTVSYTGHTHTGSEVKLTGYSKVSSYSEISASDTVNQAIAKLEGALSGLETLLASI